MKIWIIFGVLSLFVIPLLWVEFGVPVINEYLDELYIEIEHEGIITDKWKRIEPVFLMGGDERFYFEINNEFTDRVEADEWYNYEIGQYRNWTTREIKKEYRND